MEDKKVLEDKVAEAKKAAEKKEADEKRIAELVAEMRRQYCQQQGRPVDGTTFIPEKEAEFRYLAEKKLAAEEAQAKAGPAVPLSEAQKTLKEKMSGLSDAFKGGRFEFIGVALEAVTDFFVKLMPTLQSFLPMLKNIAPVFNREAAGYGTPSEMVNTLLEEGRLNAATEVVKEEELQLIQDMEKVFEDNKEVKAFKDQQARLTQCREDLRKLETDLEKLTPLKKDPAKKEELKACLEQIEADLKQIRAHYVALAPFVKAAGDSLKSLPMIFARMEPILEANQALLDKEVAALPKQPPAKGPAH